MNKFRKLMRSPFTTGVLFVLAAVLLLSGTIGGVRAAPNRESNFLMAGVEMYHIGVTLTESNQPDGSSPVNISWRNYVQNSDNQWSATTGELCKHLLDPADQEKVHGRYVSNLSPVNKPAEGDTQFKIGQTYPEFLAVTNSGVIDTYVRVTVNKFWCDVKPDGSLGDKRTDLDPSLIKLGFVEGDWTIDTGASTDERVVLYYNGTLAPGASSSPFLNSVAVSSEVINKVAQSAPDANGVIKNIYIYDGEAFQLEVTVDAVQTHNADAAKTSAWGFKFN